MTEMAHASDRRHSTVERRSTHTSGDRRGHQPRWPGPAAVGPAGSARWVMQLQRQVGNQAVGRLLRAGQREGSGHPANVLNPISADRAGGGSELQPKRTAAAGRTASPAATVQGDADGHAQHQNVSPVVRPAWVQRCGIDSSCGCPPDEKATGIQRDLQVATSTGVSPLVAGSEGRTKDASSGVSPGQVASGRAVDDLTGIEPAHAHASAGGIQAELPINQPGDVYEQEADRMAERVVTSAPLSGGQGVCAACAAGATSCPTCAEGQQTVQEKAWPGHALSPSAGTGPPIGGLGGVGQPLPPSTRAPLESQFDRDFSSVRIHTGRHASDSSRLIQARAYTWGPDVVFGSGEFAPDSRAGQRLLAHELTHVVQQGHAPPRSKQNQPSSTEPIGGSQARITHTGNRIARQADAGVPATDPADAGVATIEPPHIGSPGVIDSPGSDRYSRQAACVAERGACAHVLPGGTVQQSEILGYNEKCAEHTNYSGPVIYPSEEECRQVREQKLVDPEKIRRLGLLTSQYQARLQRGELTLGDALRIDAALRRAHAALQRGGVPIPSVPEPVALSPADDLAGPALALVPAVALLETPVLPAAGAAATTAATGAATGAVVTEGAAATGAVVGGGAAVTAGAVLVGVALVVVVGLTIYWIYTLDSPRVDPTIPQAVDEATETIQKTLDTAPAPKPQAKPLPDIGPLPDQRKVPEQLCTNEQLGQLRREKDKLCNVDRSCTNQGDTCASAISKIAANYACIDIRQRIQKNCFTKGHPEYEGHMLQIAQASAALRSCIKVMQEKCK